MIKYSGGYVYQLKEDYKIELKHPDWRKCNYCIDTKYIKLNFNILEIKEGYMWDGASCFPDFKSIMEGSLVHDSLYQLLRMEKLPQKYRLMADYELRELCKENGMAKILADLVFIAVELFAANAASPKNRKKIITV